MKGFKIQVIVIILIIGAIISICLFANIDKSVNKNTSTDYLRLHIRANSNSVEDQNIKYKVKNEIVILLTPIVANVKTKSELEKVLKNNENLIEYKVNEILIENGFDYGCNMELNNEFFPTRAYEDVVLEADYYDALIINLGSGTGNNWWCVVYPPLCFVGEITTSENVVYKSKLMEIIDKFFNKCKRL